VVLVLVLVLAAGWYWCWCLLVAASCTRPEHLVISVQCSNHLELSDCATLVPELRNTDPVGSSLLLLPMLCQRNNTVPERVIIESEQRFAAIYPAQISVCMFRV